MSTADDSETRPGPRLAILGAGAVGGYAGGCLAEAGFDVTLVGTWHANIEAIRDHGLTLAGPEVERLVRVRMLGVGEVSSRLFREPPIDIALVACKSYDTAWMTALIAPYLAADGIVVSVQNGINEPAIADIVGARRTLGCIAAGITVELVAPGRILRDRARLVPGKDVFRVGELDGAVTPRLRRLAEILQHVDNTKITANLSGERWAKLASNAMNGGMAAATGLGAKQAMADETLRAFMIELGIETVRTGIALGHRLEPIGALGADLFARAGAGDTAAREKIDHAFAAEGDPRPPKRVSSMGQDVLRGRRTEIESLNGLVVAEAKKLRLEAPANARVVEIVRAIERGGLTAAPGNILEACQPAES